MTMTNTQEATMVKWILGIYATLMLALIGYQAQTTAGLRNDMIEFMKDNAEQHNDILIMMKGESNYTKTIYEYEITPNTDFRQKYEPILENEYGGE